MATILYLGDCSHGSSSTDRANALSRLGHTVICRDPYKEFHKQLKSRWLGAIHFRSGYRLLDSRVTQWLRHVISNEKPDIVWVNSGELFGPASLKILKRLGRPIVLYMNDDPLGKRDGRRFDSLVSALKFYDFCIVVREVNVSEFKAQGARHVLRVFMSYDEVAHQPFASYSDIPTQFRSEVAFIGTWMRHEKRDEFVLNLIQQGVPLSIWGDRWEKSPLFGMLKSHWRGGALHGRDYVAALQGAKVCIGLLSKGNRDMHTMRSLETPYSGGLLCAERTPEHQQLYKEGVEAVFWSDVNECGRLCKELLADDEKRERIRLAGMKRIRELHAGNEDVCKTILNFVFTQQEK